MRPACAGVRVSAEALLQSLVVGAGKGSATALADAVQRHLSDAAALQVPNLSLELSIQATTLLTFSSWPHYILTLFKPPLNGPHSQPDEPGHCPGAGNVNLSRLYICKAGGGVGALVEAARGGTVGSR